MPSIVVETDTFAASVQRPNNGELADAASILQYESVDASRDRFLYNRSRSAQYDVTRAPYSADPTGGVSSQTAITNAIAAAAAAGGDVFIPPGTYLYTGLSVPQGVNIFGGPGAELFNTGAGSSIVFTQPNDGPPSVIEGLRFHASGVSTATVVTNSADARAIFRGCVFNGYAAGGGYFTNLQGKLALTGSAASWLIFEGCDFTVGGALIGLHCVAGRIAMLRGSLVMPGAYGTALAYVDAGELSLDRVRCDVRAHASGTAEILYAPSSAPISALRDCVIDDAGAAGTIYGHLWTSGAKVAYHGNLYTGSAVTPHGNSTAAAGSRIELEPTLAIDVGAAPTVDLTNSGRFKSILVKGTASCVVTLPAGLFPGQELLFTFFNADISGHNVTFATTPLTGVTIPNPVGAGNTLSCVLVWESRDVSGAYRWVQKGAWGTGLTLV